MSRIYPFPFLLIFGFAVTLAYSAGCGPQSNRAFCLTYETRHNTVTGATTTHHGYATVLSTLVSPWPFLPSSSASNSHSFAVEFWIKPSVPSSGGGDSPWLGTKRSFSSASSRGFMISASNAGPGVTVSLGSGPVLVNGLFKELSVVLDEPNVVVQDGDWHHIAVSFEFGTGNSQIALWVDGVIVGTASTAGMPATSGSPAVSPYASLTIGQEGAGQYFYSFKGCIDAIRIWNSAFTSTAAQTSPNGVGASLALNVDGSPSNLVQDLHFTFEANDTISQGGVAASIKVVPSTTTHPLHSFALGPDGAAPTCTGTPVPTSTVDCEKRTPFGVLGCYADTACRWSNASNSCVVDEICVAVQGSAACAETSGCRWSETASACRPDVYRCERFDNSQVSCDLSPGCRASSADGRCLADPFHCERYLSFAACNSPDPSGAFARCRWSSTGNVCTADPYRCREDTTLVATSCASRKGCRLLHSSELGASSICGVDGEDCHSLSASTCSQRFRCRVVDGVCQADGGMCYFRNGNVTDCKNSPSCRWSELASDGFLTLANGTLSAATSNCGVDAKSCRSSYTTQTLDGAGGILACDNSEVSQCRWYPSDDASVCYPDYVLCHLIGAAEASLCNATTGCRFFPADGKCVTDPAHCEVLTSATTCHSRTLADAETYKSLPVLGCRYSPDTGTCSADHVECHRIGTEHPCMVRSGCRWASTESKCLPDSLFCNAYPQSRNGTFVCNAVAGCRFSGSVCRSDDAYCSSIASIADCENTPRCRYLDIASANQCRADPYNCHLRSSVATCEEDDMCDWRNQTNVCGVALRSCTSLTYSDCMNTAPGICRWSSSSGKCVEDGTGCTDLSKDSCDDSVSCLWNSTAKKTGSDVSGVCLPNVADCESGDTFCSKHGCVSVGGGPVPASTCICYASPALGFFSGVSCSSCLEGYKGEDCDEPQYSVRLFYYEGILDSDPDAAVRIVLAELLGYSSAAEVPEDRPIDITVTAASAWNSSSLEGWLSLWNSSNTSSTGSRRAIDGGRLLQAANGDEDIQGVELAVHAKSSLASFNRTLLQKNVTSAMDRVANGGSKICSDLSVTGTSLAGFVESETELMRCNTTTTNSTPPSPDPFLGFAAADNTGGSDTMLYLLLLLLLIPICIVVLVCVYRRRRQNDKVAVDEDGWAVDGGDFGGSVGKGPAAVASAAGAWGSGSGGLSSSAAVGAHGVSSGRDGSDALDQAKQEAAAALLAAEEAERRAANEAASRYVAETAASARALDAENRLIGALQQQLDNLVRDEAVMRRTIFDLWRQTFLDIISFAHGDANSSNMAAQLMRTQRLLKAEEERETVVRREDAEAIQQEKRKSEQMAAELAAKNSALAESDRRAAEAEAALKIALASRATAERELATRKDGPKAAPLSSLEANVESASKLVEEMERKRLEAQRQREAAAAAARPGIIHLHGDVMVRCHVAREEDCPFYVKPPQPKQIPRTNLPYPKLRPQTKGEAPTWVSRRIQHEATRTEAMLRKGANIAPSEHAVSHSPSNAAPRYMS